MSDGHYPVNEHDHVHSHAGHHHHHGHGEPSLPEEPLDPANQSLADALRASFRVLKLIMVALVILFLASGVFIVDQNEVVVLTRFGAQDGPPLEPGLHWAWPYPVNDKIRVPADSRAMMVETFWFNLSETDKVKPVGELAARSGGLDPAIDGALLTGDRAIMHLLARIDYQITDAASFVRNVKDESRLLRAVLHKATVAEAARVKADSIWKSSTAAGSNEGGNRLAAAIKVRAQAELDMIESGVRLDNVLVEQSLYPLQVKDDYLAVSQAQNQMREKIQEANKVWEEKLKGAAGPAWERISREIERIDQVEESERAEVVKAIDELLTNEATGEAGRLIKLAEGNRDKVVNDTITAAQRFEVMLEEYRRSPELVRQRLRQDMLARIFTQPVSRWYLPAGQKAIWFNKDPEESRDRAREDMRSKAGVR